VGRQKAVWLKEASVAADGVGLAHGKPEKLCYAEERLKAVLC
jgi:hypothetical protein